MVKCKYADKYKAVYPPRCGGDDGPCDVCREKWEQKIKALKEIIKNA